MTIIITYNVAGDTATVTRLERVNLPEVWNQAFFQVKGLDGVLKFMVPLARVGSISFEDNAISI